MPEARLYPNAASRPESGTPTTTSASAGCSRGYGRLPDGGYVAASESCALRAVGAEFIRDLEPGEILIFQNGGPGLPGSSAALLRFPL